MGGPKVTGRRARARTESSTRVITAKQRVARDDPFAPAPVRGILVVVAGPDSGRVFALGSDVAIVGRDPRADVRVDHPTVSWRHARIVRAGAREYFVEDLGSTNGTFVEGAIVATGRRRRLVMGDVVQIGLTVALTFTIAGAREEARLRRMHSRG